MPSDEGEPQSPGLAYTFYSYKGGVGRSMALVNVGVLMAFEGHRVLLVDWDLEAPGLETFFEKSARLTVSPEDKPGIVDLLEARATDRSLSWRDCLLKAEFLGRSLDIISAGRRSEDYRSRLQGLDWGVLFREYRIGNYVDSLREEWRRAYDFILIDSRTGMTDIGDICTVLLPDILVLLFVTNHQNVQGSKKIMERAVRARAGLPVNRSKLLAVPVPARDERDKEYDRSLEWQRTYAQEFGDLYREWLPATVAPSDALNRLFIPYVASWSFGERIPVLESERERADPTSLGAAYARLATLLTHRLDWNSIEANAELVGTRVELARARDEVRQAEERREKAEASARRKTRVRTLLAFLLILASGLGSFWYWKGRTPPSTELFVGDALLKEGKSTEALEVFRARLNLLDRDLRSNSERAGTSQRAAVLADRMSTLFRIASVLSAHGKSAEALSSLQAAQGVGKELLAKDGDNSDWLFGLAEVGNRLGWILQLHGQSTQALKSCQEARSIGDGLVKKDKEETAWQYALAKSHSCIGQVLQSHGQILDALASFEARKAIVDGLTKKDGADEESQILQAETLHHVGMALESQGTLAHALEAFHYATPILDRLVAHDPDNSEWQTALGVNYDLIGKILEWQGKLPDALAYAGQENTIFRKLATRDPANTDWQAGLCRSHHRIGAVLAAQGKLSEALESLQSANTISERLATLDPSNTAWKRSLAFDHRRIGAVFELQDELANARTYLQSGTDIFDALEVQDPANVEWQVDLLASLTRLGHIFVRLGRGDEAAQRFQLAGSILGRPRVLSLAEGRRSALQLKRYASEERLLKGDLAGAAALCSEGRALANEVRIDNDNLLFWQPSITRLDLQCAEVPLAKGDKAAALTLLADARDKLTALMRASPSDASLRSDLAWAEGRLRIAGSGPQ